MVAARRGSAWVAGAVVTVLVALAIWRGVAHRADAADAPKAAVPAVPVVTAVAAREDVPIYLTGIGTVQPAQTVTIKARVDGQLDKIGFTEGQDVRQGDLLAQIDARPFQAALEQAQAQKARDDAQLASAQKDLERYTVLVGQDSIPQQTADTQKALVAQLKAAVQSDTAQVDNARVQLGYTTIRAPVSGRTGMRLVDVGNIVHAADATGIVVINQVDPINVVFTLPQDQFQKVNAAIRANPRTPLAASAFSRGDKTALGSGKLLLINNQIDSSTGTFQLKASFPNPAHRLWPGQDVDVRLVLGQKDGATTVPDSVVQRGASGLLAYVVKADETVAVQPIKVAQVQDGKAVISEGLEPGTRVIVDGQYKVKPGVRVVEAGGAKASAAAKQAAR
jgi:membrane fusion protein, multidrug efflux system